MEASGYSLAGLRKPEGLSGGNFFPGPALYYYVRPENADAARPLDSTSRGGKKIFAREC